MLYVFGLMFLLVGVGFFSACYFLFLEAEALHYRDLRAIICPETLRWAEVRVDAAHAARTAFAGHTEVRLVACSRWPARQGCAQACAPEVLLVGDDRRLTRFAPFALDPRFLRINNPVRMSPAVYARLAPQLNRRVLHPTA